LIIYLIINSILITSDWASKMWFVSGKKQKTPSELVRTVKESVNFVVANPKALLDKVNEEITKSLANMKFVIYGDGEHEPNADQVTMLANEIQAHDLIPLVIQHVAKLEFEAKKDFVSVFSNILRRQVGARFPTVEYICSHPEIITNLVKGYENADIALTNGPMLRECVKHEAIAKLLLNSDLFWDFFAYVEVANFEVASDAFATFKELLTKHKALSADFLEKHYDQVFEKYTQLLHSQSYVIRRQSLKLLGELLLDRANFNIMTRYISSSSNLKLMMNLLRDKSRTIQFEAFHVFKVFVANPNKTKPVLAILQQNKDRLIAFLTAFHTDKEDEQFNDEKAFLLKQIQAIQPE